MLVEAIAHDADILEIEITHHRTQEQAPLLERFEQHGLKIAAQNCENHPRKTAAGADINPATGSGEMRRNCESVCEVLTRQNLEVPRARQVDPAIPA